MPPRTAPPPPRTGPVPSVGAPPIVGVPPIVGAPPKLPTSPVTPPSVRKPGDEDPFASMLTDDEDVIARDALGGVDGRCVAAVEPTRTDVVAVENDLLTAVQCDVCAGRVDAGEVAAHPVVDTRRA